MEAVFARGDRRLCDVLIKALKRVLSLMDGQNTSSLSMDGSYRGM